MAGNQKNVLLTISTKANVTGVRKAADAVGNLRDKLSELKNRYADVGSAAQKASRRVDSFNTVMDEAERRVRATNTLLFNLFGGIRQIGQAFQNVGAMMSFFISFPLQRFLRYSIELMVEFDEKLIEVRKNAGITSEEMRKLGDALTRMSRGLPQTVVELATIADMAARLGLRGVPAISAFTDAVAKLEVATDLDAEDAAKALAKLVTLFYEGGKSGQEFTRFLNAVGSALNEVGQTTAATESQILSTIVRAAPAAAALEMPVAQLIGLAGAIAEAAASAERGGTQLNRALTELATNAVNVAKSVGLPVEELRRMVDDDPTEVFLAVAEAIGNMDSASLRAAASAELFGETGAKVTSIIAAAGDGVDRVVEKIRVAEAAFADATSLEVEFSRAMDAVSNQLKLLRNNINVIAVSVGKVLLPQITKMLTYVIPAVRELADWFDSLSERTKLMAVGALVLATALGPLLLLFGSMIFSVGILATGFVSLFSALTAIVGIPIRLATSFAVFALGLSRLQVILIAVVLSVVKFRDELSAIFQNLIGDMGRWGFNIFAAFADGITSAIGYAVNAAVQFANAIARFFEASSPPKEGPLSEMDEWGRKTAEAWADGFASASVDSIRRYAGIVSETFESFLRRMPAEWSDAFSGLTRVVRTAATAVGRLMNMDAGDLGKNVSKAIEALGEVLEGIRAGGNLAGAAWEKLSSAVGQFSDDIRTAITLQSELVDESRRLEEIRKRLESIDSELQDQIVAISARIDLTVEERSALIRQAKLRAAARKRQLQDEEKAAEDRVDVLKDELDRTTTIIDTIASIIQSATAGDRGRKPKEEDFIPIGGFQEAALKLRDALAEPFKLAVDEMGAFMKRLSETEKAVKAFIAGFRGEDKLSAVLGISDEDAAKLRQMMTPEEVEGLIAGSPLGEIYDKGAELRQRIDEVVEGVRNFADALSDLIAAVASGDLDGIVNAIVRLAGVDAENIDEASSSLKRFALAMGILGAILFGWGPITGILRGLLRILGPLGRVLVFLGGGAAQGGLRTLGWLGSVLAFLGSSRIGKAILSSRVVRILATALGFLGKLPFRAISIGLRAILGAISGIVGGVSWPVVALIAAILAALGVAVAVVARAFSRYTPKLFKGAKSLVDAAKMVVQTIREKFVQGIKDGLARFGYSIEDLNRLVGLVVSPLKWLWQKMRSIGGGLGKAWDWIVDKVVAGIDWLAERFGFGMEIMLKVFEKVGGLIAGGMGNFLGTILGGILWVVDAFGRLFSFLGQLFEEGPSKINWKGIGEALLAALPYILTVVARAGMNIGRIIVTIISDFVSRIDWGKIWNSLRDLWNRVGRRRIGVLAKSVGTKAKDSILDKLKEIDWGTIVKKFASWALGKGKLLVAFVAGLVGGYIRDIISSKIAELKDKYNQIKDLLVEWFQENVSSITEQATDIGASIKDAIVDKLAELRNAYNVIADKFREWWDSLKNDPAGAILSVAEAIGTTIRAKITGALAAIKENFNIIARKFKQWWDELKNRDGNDILTAAKELGGKMIDWIKDGITGAWTSFVDWLAGKIKGAIGAIINAITGGDCEECEEDDDNGGDTRTRSTRRRSIPGDGLGGLTTLTGDTIGSLTAPAFSKVPEAGAGQVVVNMTNNFYVSDDADIEEAARRIARQIVLAGA